MVATSDGGKREVLRKGDEEQDGWREVNERNRRKGNGEVRVYSLGGFGFAGDETFPCFIAFFDYFEGVFLVLAFSAEGKRILWLPIGDLNQQSPKKTKKTRCRQIRR